MLLVLDEGLDVAVFTAITGLVDSLAEMVCVRERERESARARETEREKNVFVCQRAKARYWPELSRMCHICSTAGLDVAVFTAITGLVDSLAEMVRQREGGREREGERARERER